MYAGWYMVKEVTVESGNKYVEWLVVMTWPHQVNEGHNEVHRVYHCH